MMCKKRCLGMLSGLLLFAAAANAQQGALLLADANPQQAPEQKSVIRETRTEGLLTGAIYRAWQQLRSLSPKSGENRNEPKNLTATAGIRGAEQTDTVLKPYWKDDRTQSPAFMAQLEAYGKAQSLIEAGRFKEASAALDAFIKDYPDSEWLPNAWFAKGLALSAADDAQGATAALNTFIKTYPKHPMRADAEEVIAGFKK